MLFSQSASPRKRYKGPRALALLEFRPKGKTLLIPVAILVDGEFYDASAYKASPVPMALDSGTVYEGERSGASQGLFTISSALQGPNRTWAGAGTWLPAGTKAATGMRKAESKPRDLETEEGPPVLHRAGKEQPKPAAPAKEPTPASPQSSGSPAGSAAPDASKPTPPTSQPESPAEASSTGSSPPSAPSPAADDDDPNQPRLRRGKPAPRPEESPAKGASPAAKASTAAAAGAKPAGAKATTGPGSEVQMMTAISDAAGPDPHSFVYPMKPEDEQQLRKKMLAIASDQVLGRAKELEPAAGATQAPSSARAASAKEKSTRRVAKKPQPQPSFEDLQLRVVDPSTSNEPVAVLTANARLPQPKGEASPGLAFMVTVVAREDIYGELHKIFANVTDAQHLDIFPRYDLIDVVDADGDGHGELLFRKTSGTATAYSIYRVIGLQLWPLFDGVLPE
jgi:hypothetical protein